MDKLIDTRAKITPLAHAAREGFRGEDKGSTGKAGGSRGRAGE